MLGADPPAPFEIIRGQRFSGARFGALWKLHGSIFVARAITPQPRVTGRVGHGTRLALQSSMRREPSIGAALDRTVEAGQSLILGRFELLLAEVRKFFQDSAILLIASVIAVTGWVYLMRGLTHGLSEHYPRYAVDLGVGAVHVGAALVLFFLRGRPR